MKILVTGAGGFVGKNLCAELENIAGDKAKSAVRITQLFKYDIGTAPERLAEYCRQCDFVFHLAGVNRPQTEAEFTTGNVDLTQHLLSLLEQSGNRCPVMLASSVQSLLDNPYGRSKAAGERLVAAYGERTGAKTLIYRFPNLFGKWCRPNYNSAVATFCYNIAHDLPITVHDERTCLTLCYIDDVVRELIAALSGHETRENGICTVPVQYKKTLGETVRLLRDFADFPATLGTPDLRDDFAAKLYATYLSYLPPEKLCYDLEMHTDARGSFTELLRTASAGQVSVNVSKPGITKGNHWHHTKHEKFIVVKGIARILLRKIGTDEAGNPFLVREFTVSGEKLQAVQMIPGYTHCIENASETEDLVTVMWASECFNPLAPDTYFEEVSP